MKIQTFSVIVGNKTCNAQCPFCVSKMTPSLGVNCKRNINWRNFKKGCQFAKDSGVSTVIITGKGEPTLFHDEITDFLKHLKKFNFPFIELQTNGIILWQQKEQYLNYLKKWYELGLTTIAISVVDYDDQRNQVNYQPEGQYMNLRELISNLHHLGFSVRISCVMFRGGIDSVTKVKRMIKFAKDNKIEQLSLRELALAKESEDKKVAIWTKNHLLSENQLSKIKKYISLNGFELMKLCHGAVVYDIDGQNVCLTNALTLDSDPEDIRQLIFFPDGHLRYDWQFQGAILI